VKKLLEECREKLATWCFALDTSSDPHSTQFGYCVKCYVPEYKPHKPDCAVLELLTKLDKEIKKHGKKK